LRCAYGSDIVAKLLGLNRGCIATIR
jgi:hypothetical protein